MNVVELRKETELQGLRSAWDAVLRESAAANTCLTWEWATAWWSAYGKPGALRLLKAVDEQGTVRGLAPLYVKKVRRFGVTVDALAFVGDGSNDSDYLDFIVATGYEEPVLGAFRRHWAESVPKGVTLLLNEIPATSRNLPLLKRLAAEERHLWTETERPCSAIPLPESWEAYLGQLRPRFRTKVRSVLRNLEDRGEISFGFCRNDEEIQRMLPVLFDQHGRRWAQDGKPGVFGWEEKRKFYRAVSPLLLERDWLRFSWLSWNGHVIACQYGFVFDRVYFQLQEGYEPAAEHYSPGSGLRAWSIRELLKEGVRAYDFMGGNAGRHKSDWGASIKTSRYIVESAPTLRNLLFARGANWEERVKERVAPLVPGKILDARRFLRERRRLSDGSFKTWIRRSAAKFYLQSGLPALIRPLRERYQISLSMDDRRPGLSLARRTQPAARILYYHRVNDDNDPFFPAIPTALFEREMRYLAKHYKVLSLSGLRRHLESGAPETVLAITFDDGYQDNYHNAFPILRRYKLPATIFLTTEPIESREPLWFERLALALKNTPRDCLDLELDIPRRFWLRTEQERLDANGRLGQLFRTMPDAEMRRRLVEVFGLLDPQNDGERREKMLTWDQVREMKSHGIEFGGHTVTHPFLSRVTPEQAVREVTECKKRIEAELQAPVKYFAYPNGREEDFRSWNTQLLRNAGYQAALTTIWGVNYSSTDPMQFHRGQPWEEDAAMFAYKLDWYELASI
jgi:peptidoglycan/xylan/chitin deacetylase (PgdA/CDA1 family)/CelD/BcsL family acetyltransferase involved in cellulose biosynthesis